MVSSRCVSGLSTGTLAVSIIKIINKDIPVNRRVGNPSNEFVIVAENICVISIVFNTKAIAAHVIMVIGSAIADRLISRELPIPPKVEPASRPSKAIKNLADTIRYKNNIIFAGTESAGGKNNTGTNVAAAITKPIFRYGANLIIKEAFLE